MAVNSDGKATTKSIKDLETRVHEVAQAVEAHIQSHGQINGGINFAPVKDKLVEAKIALAQAFEQRDKTDQVVNQDNVQNEANSQDVAEARNDQGVVNTTEGPKANPTNEKNSTK